jgi:uncharacterized protein
MELQLKKRPVNPTIITGFPSIGLVGTIVTKYLIDHLDIEIIGSLQSDQLAPLIAIHKGKVVDPITVYYNKKYNIVIMQALMDVAGSEIQISKSVVDLVKQLNAKEVIVIEGMPTQDNKVDIYYYSSKAKVISKVQPLKEGVIMGVTAAMLLKSDQIPLTTLFVQAHQNLPDSEAGAKVIGVLNDYLGLDLDVKPLIESAKKFESNLKSVLKKSVEQQPQSLKAANQDRDLSYLG